MSKFLKAVLEAWRNRKDADFSGLTWQGWDECRSLAVETATQECGDAIFELTQQGYCIMGVNRSARLLHISTPGRIALNIAEPYDSHAPRKGFLNNVTRICTHGRQDEIRH